MSEKPPQELSLSRRQFLDLTKLFIPVFGLVATVLIFEQSFDIIHRLDQLGENDEATGTETEPFKLGNGLFSLYLPQEEELKFTAYEPAETAGLANRLRQILNTVVRENYVPDASDASYFLKNESHTTPFGRETRPWIEYKQSTSREKKQAIYDDLLSNPNIPWRVHRLKFDEHTREVLLLITIEAAQHHSRPLLISIQADELVKMLKPEEMQPENDREMKNILSILASLGLSPLRKGTKLNRQFATDPINRDYALGYSVEIGQIESPDPTEIPRGINLIVTDIAQRNEESWALARISDSQPILLNGYFPKDQYFWIKLADITPSDMPGGNYYYQPQVVEE